MASIINTGISALHAFKRQMETTGHNISNVNTEGYSRQRVGLATRIPEPTPQGYIGSGTEVASIRRVYDDYLADRVRAYTSSHESYAIYEDRARQIDDVIADASAGLDGMLQQFFASVNDVADDPRSMPARAVMLNRAEQLGDRFNALDRWFNDQRGQLNRDLQNQANELNALAASLAQVNRQVIGMGSGATGAANDILDQRDHLIDQISRYASVTTMEQPDGAINVAIGSGQPLVIGTRANTLQAVPGRDTPDRYDLTLRTGSGGDMVVTDRISGGSIGGLLQFRDEVLDQAHDGLGRVAVGVAHYVNAEHRTGMDLDGDFGGDFFTEPVPVPAAASPNNAAGSSVTLGFADVSALTGHEYRLAFDGGGWTMTDLSTGRDVALTGSGTAADPLVGDGVSIVVDAAAAGDRYRLRPTRGAAAAFGVQVSNERDIAAAEIAGTSALATNSGTASIDGGAQVNRTTAPARLAAPLTLQFDAGAGQFAVYSGNPPAGPALTTIPYDPASDSGSTLTIPAGVTGFGDYALTMRGTPADGDSFVLADNTGGIGDNRNALRLADLQTARVMSGGTATLANTYGALVADVGTRTGQAINNAEVHNRLLSQAETAKSEVSGVNLDEEAANLVRFQQAYQAAAQVINVANTLFDSLLGAVRR